MQRPNILFIVTDQQRWDALGANGNENIQTPNLDGLADDGVNFDHCFVQNPICMPSRASMLTGQYPSQLRIYWNGVTLPEETITLPKMVRNYGYETANIGKLHLTTHANRDDRNPHPTYGFDHLELSDARGNYRDAYRAWVRSKDPKSLANINRGLSGAGKTWLEIIGGDETFPDSEISRGEYHPPREEYDPPRPIPFDTDANLTHSAFVAEQTIEYLRDQQDDRFLCVSGFHEPHSPFIVPEKFIEKYDPDELEIPEFPPSIEEQRSTMDGFSDDELRHVVHGYYSMTSQVDYHVGRILDELDRLGLREDTLVVFTSDHGEFLGEHLRYGKGWPGHDCISRVPCLVRWPDMIEDPGRTESGLVESVDLLPTLLEAAGIQIPAHLQGESVRPALRDEGFSGREDVLLESKQGRTLRTDRYRYVHHRDGSESLYRVDSTHGAYMDIAEGNPDVVSDLRHRLLNRVTNTAIRDERDRTWAY